MNIWAKGLLAAALSGIGSALAAVLIDPTHFNFSEWRHLAALAVGGAIIGVAGYLKQSPLPTKEP